MAEERGMTVDIAGYERLMEEAKTRSRVGAKKASGTRPRRRARRPPEARAIPPTEDQAKFDGEPRCGDGQGDLNGENFDEASAPRAARPGGVVLDPTNFYAEMGGQVGDTGRITVTRETRFRTRWVGGEFKVEAVKAFGGYVLHVGHDAAASCASATASPAASTRGGACRSRPTTPRRTC